MSGTGSKTFLSPSSKIFWSSTSRISIIALPPIPSHFLYCIIEQSAGETILSQIIIREYKKAVPAYQYFKALEKAPVGHTFTKEQKQRIGLDFIDDDEDELDYRDFLFDVILDRMTEEDQSYIAQEYQLAHDMADEERINRLQNISDKLQELSGRKNSFRVKYDILAKRESIKLGKTFER